MNNILILFFIYIRLKSAFTLCSAALALASILQCSLVNKKDWLKIVGCTASIDKDFCTVPSILVQTMQSKRLSKLKYD